MTEQLVRQALVEYGQPLSQLEEALPVPVGTEVLLKIRHCGVCHSDLHLQDGYFATGGESKQSIAALHSLPHTLGHEMEGEVVSFGPDAEGVARGDRRIVYPWIGCGKCRNCKRGKEHFCDAPRSLGLARSGGFATHVIAPHPRYLLDYSGIPQEKAGSMMCAGLTSWGAIKKCAPEVRDANRLIIGLGGVGMMALLLSRLIYEEAPVVAEICPEKRERALAMGAKDVFDPGDPRQMRDVLRKHGWFDGIMDYVGSEKTMTMSNRLASRGCQIVVVGLYGGELRYPLPMLTQREVSIKGTYVCSLSEAKEMLDLIREKGNLDGMAISTRPLEEANNALDDLRAGKVNGRIVLTNT